MGLHFPDMFSLAGKVAIVTGGRRGLGRSMAMGLAEAGADVVIVDMHPAETVAEEIRQLGRRSIDMQVDVSKPDEVNNMVSETMKQFGHIDILVNNAGISLVGLIENIPKEIWDKTMAVNLTGVFLCSQAVGKCMIKQKEGNIINISSIYGLVASVTESTHYSVSKAGVWAFTRELAVKWAKYNIRVNAIAPTFFNTDMTKSGVDKDFYENIIVPRTPLRRAGEPEELKGAVIFLASEASSMVTGHTLLVDGGWCSWH